MRAAMQPHATATEHPFPILHAHEPRLAELAPRRAAEFVVAFGEDVTSSDWVHYAYALLHSAEYHARCATEGRRPLAWIPRVATREQFDRFVWAGEALAALHRSWTDAMPYELDIDVSPRAPADPAERYRITKLRWATERLDDGSSRTDHALLVYNQHILIGDIPPSARPAIDWVIRNASQLIDPDEPRALLDRIRRLTRAGVDTQAIVDSLPSLDPMAAG